MRPRLLDEMQQCLAGVLCDKRAQLVLLLGVGAQPAIAGEAPDLAPLGHVMPFLILLQPDLRILHK